MTLARHCDLVTRELNRSFLPSRDCVIAFSVCISLPKLIGHALTRLPTNYQLAAPSPTQWSRRFRTSLTLMHPLRDFLTFRSGLAHASHFALHGLLLHFRSRLKRNYGNNVLCARAAGHGACVSTVSDSTSKVQKAKTLSNKTATGAGGSSSHDA
jgi:hypothetical protein